MDKKQLIKIKNFGKTTRLKVLDIDISKACHKLNFSSHNFEGDRGGIIMTEIDISKLTEIITSLTEEEIINANEIFKSYLPKKKETQKSQILTQGGEKCQKKIESNKDLETKVQTAESIDLSLIHI